MSEAYPLLKQGSNLPYYQCDCCRRFVRELSQRAWCVACEYELTQIGQRVRAIINSMTTPPGWTDPVTLLPTWPRPSTADHGAETPAGSVE